jgi:L-seryl-tRNA(Ser) seleniumtransferase
VTDALDAGAGLVLFSGDKLLGGPQAGCIVGRRELVARCREHPIARAVRTDKMTLAALEATLALYRDPVAALEQVPVLRMLTESPGALAERADRLASALPPALGPELVAGQSAVGGGSFPGADLPTTLVSLDAGPLGPDRLALRLRLGHPAVVTRTGGGRVLLDPRTLPDGCEPALAGALVEALRE